MQKSKPSPNSGPDAEMSRQRGFMKEILIRRHLASQKDIKNPQSLFS